MLRKDQEFWPCRNLHWQVLLASLQGGFSQLLKQVKAPPQDAGDAQGKEKTLLESVLVERRPPCLLGEAAE